MRLNKEAYAFKQRRFGKYVTSNILTKSSLFKRIRDDSVWDIFQVEKAQIQISSSYEKKTAYTSLRLTMVGRKKIKLLSHFNCV